MLSYKSRNCILILDVDKILDFYQILVMWEAYLLVVLVLFSNSLSFLCSELGLLFLICFLVQLVIDESLPIMVIFALGKSNLSSCWQFLLC